MFDTELPKDVTIEFYLVFATKDEAETLKAEKAHIKKMLDKAFSECGTFLQIGEYQRFRTDIIRSITYKENNENKVHQIFVNYAHTDDCDFLEMPFGFLDKN